MIGRHEQASARFLQRRSTRETERIFCVMRMLDDDDEKSQNTFGCVLRFVKAATSASPSQPSKASRYIALQRQNRSRDSSDIAEANATA